MASRPAFPGFGSPPRAPALRPLRRVIGRPRPAVRPPPAAGPRSPASAPPPAPAAAAPSVSPVRLVAADVGNPFAPGREIAFAKVAGSSLERAGVRDGDHVALLRRDAADHGDLAAVVGPDGRAALWKVYPEGDVLRLSTGGAPPAKGDGSPPLVTGPHPRVTGVVVGVLRKFRDPEGLP